MINSRDLQLNNYVLNKRNTVVRLTHTLLSIVYDRGGENEYKPIILTPDILNRGSFKLNDSCFKNMVLQYWVNNAVCLFFNDSPPENTYLVGYGFSDWGTYYASTFKWISAVHELQNYYYQFTKTELELEL